MRVCLMVEGQEGVTWRQWLDLARACESASFEALFRSDHYASVRGREDLGSLDAWATLAGLAASTETLRLGTLVSPASFRHPSIVAKMATTVDHISNGRVEVGLGAGWFEDEHRAYGFEFPDVGTRLEILREQIQIVRGQFTRQPFSFGGAHYRLADVRALPRPIQHPHPPLIVGGSGGRRSVEIAVRWADEYNTLLASTERIAAVRTALDRACDEIGRDPSTIALSLMTTCIVGAGEDDLFRRARKVARWRGSEDDTEAFLDAARDRRITGTVPQAIARLDELERAGVERVMLQHLIHDDLEMIELVGREIIPAVI